MARIILTFDANDRDRRKVPTFRGGLRDPGKQPNLSF